MKQLQFNTDASICIPPPTPHPTEIIRLLWCVDNINFINKVNINEQPNQLANSHIATNI